MTKNNSNKDFPNYTFGVELETFGVNGAVLSWALRRAGLNVVGAFADDGGNASTRRAAREQGSWDLGEDGSIRGPHPIEIRSPVLSGRSGLKEIEKVCRVLKEVGSEVNASCGLHVHIGITNAAKQGMKPFTTPEVVSIIKRYHTWEKSIDGFLAAGRRENKNQYCKSLDRLIGVVEAEVIKAQGGTVAGPVLVDAEWGRQNAMNTRGCDCADCQTLVVDQENRAREETHRRQTGKKVDLAKPETLAQFGDHYDKVSVQPLTKYGTIEFRQHHGSIDAKEITNWIRFLMNHIEVSRRLYAASEARKAALKEAEAAGVAQAPAAAPEHQKAQVPHIPKDRDILMGITPAARKHFKGQASRFSPRPRKPRKAQVADAPAAPEAPPAGVVPPHTLSVETSEQIVARWRASIRCPQPPPAQPPALPVLEAPGATLAPDTSSATWEIMEDLHSTLRVLEERGPQVRDAELYRRAVTERRERSQRRATHYANSITAVHGTNYNWYLPPVSTNDTFSEFIRMGAELITQSRIPGDHLVPPASSTPTPPQFDHVVSPEVAAVEGDDGSDE